MFNLNRNVRIFHNTREATRVLKELLLPPLWHWKLSTEKPETTKLYSDGSLSKPSAKSSLPGSQAGISKL